MTLSDRVRTNISLSLSILLVICQVITVTALIVLFKAYSSLKKKVIAQEKKLLSIQKETPRHEDATTETRTETASATTKQKSEIDKKWLMEGEYPIRVPTPLPVRRSGSTQQAPTKDLSKTFPGHSQEMTEFDHNFSFTSSAPRDSGTGSMTTRSPQNSISYESKIVMQDSCRENNSTQEEKRMSRGSHGSPTRETRFESCNMSSNTSSGFQKKSYGPQKVVRLPSNDFPSLEQEFNDEPRNQNELQDTRSSRLQTMHIGMIGLEESSFADERRNEKIRSRLLSQKQDTLDEEPLPIEGVCYANEGYHGDHDASSSGPSAFPKMVDEELVSNLISEDYEKEDYVNQEMIEAMRNDSVGSRTECNSEQDEPLYVNNGVSVPYVTRF